MLKQVQYITHVYILCFFCKSYYMFCNFLLNIHVSFVSPSTNILNIIIISIYVLHNHSSIILNFQNRGQSHRKSSLFISYLIKARLPAMSYSEYESETSDKIGYQISYGIFLIDGRSFRPNQNCTTTLQNASSK